MNKELVRSNWERLRAALNETLTAQKLSPQVPLELSKAYSLKTFEERSVINTLLAEWIVSDDEGKQFDALALIAEHRIVSALTALVKLSEKLQHSNKPSAPYDLSKVTRVIGKLTVADCLSDRI